MKILMCSPNQGTGGISRWTNALFDYYNKSNLSNIELSNYYPSNFKQTINTTPFYKRVWNAINNYVPLILKFNNKLKKIKPDIVHLVSSGSFGLLRDYLLLSITKKNNIKAIIHFRFGRIPELIKSKNWEYQILLKVINKVDKTIVLDRASIESLKQLGINKIEILPNPLSSQIVSIIQKKGFWSNKNKNILFVGHVIPTKGIEELIKASQQIDGIKIKVLGMIKEDYKNRLKKIAGENLWSRIEFMGNQSINIVIEEMCACGILVLPTYTEGFPNVIIEAMATGCPIITTPVGAIPEMLNIKSENPCGICIPSKSVRELTEAIKRLYMNEKYCEFLGKNAKERAFNEYSMDSIWNKLVNIWKDC